MDKLSPPEQMSFKGNVAENWCKWKQCFELFLAASRLSEKDDKVQSATLLHVASPDALEIYNTFAWECHVAGPDTLEIYNTFAWECHVAGS